jgi:hypothetical protein
VIEFLSAENVTPTEIHRRLQAVYGENTVNRTTVNRWAIKFCECEPGRTNIVDQPHSGRPVSVTDDKHQKQVDELIKHDRRITQKQIAGRLGIFFLVVNGPARYGRTAAMRLIVQPYDEDDHYFLYFS